MRFIIEEDQFQNFNHCPYCGGNYPSLFLGDYSGAMECLECEGDFEFLILEEYRDRYPEHFKKLVEK